MTFSLLESSSEIAFHFNKLLSRVYWCITVPDLLSLHHLSLQKSCFEVFWNFWPPFAATNSTYCCYKSIKMSKNIFPPDVFQMGDHHSNWSITSTASIFYHIHIIKTHSAKYNKFLPCDAMRCTVLVIVILSVRPSVCLSVCPSVCHTRGLCPHGTTYDHFFTIW